MGGGGGGGGGGRGGKEKIYGKAIKGRITKDGFYE